ncbi:uncharacterized protein LOC122388061 [Amphibalanus amphitrite]|uniref:uncharacterized protein LOC122388061 n=1 Tax=Amphibalanus amphitrite TaxID=1232801 RepID=UPI001C90BF73|nr:uncharacterized protein LOC122388061 [Amphibalanus amphitrite]
MSENLRKTFGLDFDFEKFVGDDDSEGADGGEEDPTAGPDATSPVPVPGQSSPEDEDRFDSMGISADHVLAEYMEMAKTPPRATRRQKEKKAYRNQAQAASKNLKASLKRRSSMDRYLSLPVFMEGSDEPPAEDTVDWHRGGLTVAMV